MSWTTPVHRLVHSQQTLATGPPRSRRTSSLPLACFVFCNLVPLLQAGLFNSRFCRSLFSDFSLSGCLIRSPALKSLFIIFYFFWLLSSVAAAAFPCSSSSQPPDRLHTSSTNSRPCVFLPYSPPPPPGSRTSEVIPTENLYSPLLAPLFYSSYSSAPPQSSYPPRHSAALLQHPTRALPSHPKRLRLLCLTILDQAF